MTYKADDHGSVDKDSESVDIDKEYKSGEDMLPVGKLAGTTATPTDSTKYALDYWTADKDVYICENDQLTAIAAGTKLTSPEGYYVAEGVTFTAHFKHFPVNVTYAAEGNGSVDKGSESVEIDKEYKSGEDMLPVGKLAGTTATPTDSTKYALDYWTADKDVYTYENEQLTTFTAGTKLTSLEDYYVAEDVTFTAHFKRTAYGVTYKTVAHGAVSPATERVAVGNTPTGCTITPDDGYEFDYWTADVSIEVADEDTSQTSSLTAGDVVLQTGTTTITAGDSITNEQLKRAVSFDNDPVFTANFKLASNKTDGSDDAGDDSDDTDDSLDNTDSTSTTNVTSGTSNSNSSNDSGSTNDTSATGNSSGNLTATGDTLGVVAIIVFLCAGVAAALVALFSRRSCHGNHRSSKKR